MSAPARCAGSLSAPPGQPDTSILLAPPTTDPGTTDDERRTIAEMMAKGTYGWILLATKDLDATFEQLQASDAVIDRVGTGQLVRCRNIGWAQINQSGTLRFLRLWLACC